MTGWEHDPVTALVELKGYTNPPMGFEVGVLPNAQDYPENEGAFLSGAESSVALIATVHELGLNDMPKREWLKKSILHNEKKITAMMKEVLDKSGDNVPRRRLLMGVMGDMTAELIQQSVLRDQLELPSNSATTLARKQGSVPMVDTGHLISVIDSEVVG